MFYCWFGNSYSAADTPWKPVIHLWKTQWPVLEFVVDKSQGQTIGMKNRKVHSPKLLTFWLVYMYMYVYLFPSCRRCMKMRKKVVC